MAPQFKLSPIQTEPGGGGGSPLDCGETFLTVHQRESINCHCGAITVRKKKKRAVSQLNP